MDYIKINPADNVAVALRDLPVGASVEGIVLSTPVPRGHKVLLVDLKEGENVVKYGFPIGHVTRDAAAGTVVDHSCIKTNLEGLLEYKYQPSFDVQSPASDSSESDKTFCGIFQPQKVLVRGGLNPANPQQQKTARTYTPAVLPGWS